MMQFIKGMEIPANIKPIEIEDAIDNRLLKIAGAIAVARRIAEAGNDDALMNMLWGVEGGVSELQQAFETLRVRAKESTVRAPRQAPDLGYWQRAIQLLCIYPSLLSRLDLGPREVLAETCVESAQETFDEHQASMEFDMVVGRLITDAYRSEMAALQVDVTAGIADATAKERYTWLFSEVQRRSSPPTAENGSILHD